MRWVLASVGLLTVIVLFSLAALNQRDVVWEGDEPHCPHCRSEVNLYATVCADCNQPFDWQTWESDCEHCLSELDAAYYKDLGEDKAAAILATIEVREGGLEDLEDYLEGIRRGACAFCSGTGRWLALGDPITPTLFELTDGDCPVCFGGGRCVFCDGDHRVVHAREAAARAMSILEPRLARLDPRRDRESALARFAAIREFFRFHTGTEEAASVPGIDSITPDGRHFGRADSRLDYMKRALDQLAGDR